jgi:hypothetical protein
VCRCHGFNQVAVRQVSGDELDMSGASIRQRGAEGTEIVLATGHDRQAKSARGEIHSDRAADAPGRASD